MKAQLAALAALLLAVPAATEEWLTNVRDRYPGISPDGEQLLFESDRGGRSAIYIARPDGTGLRLLIDSPGEPSNAAWCPDGKRLVYNEKVGAEFDLFIINADGSGRRNLTNSPSEESHPHCGPDGRIYFNSDRSTPDRTRSWGERDHDLFSMAVDGSDIRRLTRCNAVCTNPNPSADGTMVAFRMGIRSGGVSWAQRPSPMNSEIAVLNFRTGAIRNITNHSAYDTWPSWSPDSKWVAYGSNRDGIANVGQIYMTSFDGARTRRLTEGPASYGEPSFASGGKSLYVSKSLPASGSRAAFIASMPVPAE